VGLSVIERLDLLAALAAERTDEIVVTTMTATLQWPLVSSSDLDFDFLAFGMGHASDFAMGLALARPERRTIALKGDGGLLMSLGSLVTLAEYGPENLVVILFENRAYEMTGGQRLPSRVDFAGLAHSAGIDGGGLGGTGSVTTWHTIDDATADLERVLRSPGPHFIVVPVSNTEPLPPVNHTDHRGRVTRLRAALGIG
jgi:thiamine pyrophosphate-dependent acetolactate synthase large subunit-like protein